MGCSSCGGGRSASTVNYTSTNAANGASRPFVYRLVYSEGGHVDYWVGEKAYKDLAILRGRPEEENMADDRRSKVVTVDPYTGEEVNPDGVFIPNASA